MALPQEPRLAPVDQTADSRADHAEPIDHEKEVSELQMRLSHNAHGLSEELDGLEGIVRKHDTASDHFDISLATSLFKTQLALFRVIAIVKESYRRPVGFEANKAVSQLTQGNNVPVYREPVVVESNGQDKTVEAGEVVLEPGDDELPDDPVGSLSVSTAEQLQQRDGSGKGLKERLLGKK